LSALAAALAVELLDAFEELILRLGAEAYPKQQSNQKPIQLRIQVRQASARMLTMQLESKADREARNLNLGLRTNLMVILLLLAQPRI
jgi:hypothetical protein